MLQLIRERLWFVAGARISGSRAKSLARIPSRGRSGAKSSARKEASKALVEAPKNRRHHRAGTSGLDRASRGIQRQTRARSDGRRGQDIVLFPRRHSRKTARQSVETKLDQDPGCTRNASTIFSACCTRRTCQIGFRTQDFADAQSA